MKVLQSIDYKAAGVDISAGNEAVKRIKQHAESTFTPAVLNHIGAFGGMYDLLALTKSYRHPVLVQSIDGVGTKMMIAKMMQRYDTIGIDLVSATANDIVVLGAKPLTLLDYIANASLDPDIIETIVAGMAKACRENDIALIGGETAEMPGTYLPGEHDLVGVVTGVVEKNQAIQGREIAVGDVILAFPSNGLHTNGYSLARKILFDMAGLDVESEINELGSSVGEALLKPHINYTQPVLHLLNKHIAIKGMAHITGGGVLDNLPRILPKHCAAEIDKSACPIPPIFSLLQKHGRLQESESYRTFNMGMGLLIVLSQATYRKMQAIQPLVDFPEFELIEVGRIVTGHREVKLV